MQLVITRHLDPEYRQRSARAEDTRHGIRTPDWQYTKANTFDQEKACHVVKPKRRSSAFA